MARRAPLRHRDQALREFSFQVPHEIARLNPDAQQFRLENMGPMYDLETEHRVFDATKNARAFLYFPNGAVKATAAFVAINAEFKPPDESWLDPAIGHKGKEENVGMLVAGMLAWLTQYPIWAGMRPDIIGRIETGELPVIISFRQMACGAIYHTKSENYKEPESTRLMMDLTKIAG